MRRRSAALQLVLLLSFSNVALGQHTGTFTPTGNMATARVGHTATLLPDGKVLIAGGQTPACQCVQILSSAELYNPSTGRFTATGNMTTARVGHTATLLPNGKVLIVGGYFAANSRGFPLNSAELYDPATGTFSATGNTATADSGPAAVLLNDGKVLIAHGRNSPSPAAELYDPAAGTFSGTGGDQLGLRWSGTQAANLLPDGRVLLVICCTEEELYDPASGTFGLTDRTKRIYHDGFGAAALPDGGVLLAGGYVPEGDSYSSGAELYDPASGSFRPTGNMAAGRSYHTVTLLQDGTVLIAGGEGKPSANPPAMTSAEIYDPATGAFSRTGDMNNGHTEHRATLLMDGRVLLTGGYTTGSSRPASAEVYTPAGVNPVVLGSVSSLNDFNGDSKCDILRRDSAGNVALWLMNGNTVMSQTFVANVWPGWSIVDTGDFNGDGKSDILWRDSTGTVAIWLMDGAAVASYRIVASVPTDWSIAGVGDFDGDRKADILWRHSSGDVRVWLMNSYSIAGDSAVASVGTDWSIVGIGDFNGDRKADVLWRDSAGDVAVWLMDGSSVASWSSGGNVSMTSAIAGVADFNGDGKADILWRDSLGNVSLWLMDGLHVISNSFIANVWTGWAIAGVGDFNGDGKADILWRDVSGHEVIWSMNGSNIVSYGELQ